MNVSPNPMNDQIAYRAPSDVMRLARMGAAHPTRLSFLRIMLRRIMRDGWIFNRPLFDLDARGVGRAVYSLSGPNRSYSLVVFSHDLPDDQRSDRVIATAWDATFALFDGIPTAQDIDRLSQNVPYQEAGRIGPNELSLSRANKSVRLFSYVVGELSQGRQPDADELASVGYLMRTTAVYGSGKFGAKDRLEIENRPELAAPFQAEMMSVWLTRQFTIDLVNHVARCQGGDRAVALSPELAKTLGVGNSTGLGMAPFLVRHPGLLHAWATVREEALLRIRQSPDCSVDQKRAIELVVQAAIANADKWASDHPIMKTRLPELRQNLRRIAGYLQTWPTQGTRPWDALWRWGQSELGIEGQEALLSIMMEPHGDLIDGLAECLSFPEIPYAAIDGAMSVVQMRALIADKYGWALAYDFGDPAQNARFWYVSEEKLEPRLGDRFGEPGADRESPLGIASMVRGVYDDLGAVDANMMLAEFLMAHPQHRFIIRRIQGMQNCAYAEIHENLLADVILPIDMLRYKLAYFGASRFDPRSDKWVRICLFADMPSPHDIGNFDAAI